MTTSAQNNVDLAHVTYAAYAFYLSSGEIPKYN
jgi:hypothetical protein